MAAGHLRQLTPEAPEHLLLRTAARKVLSPPLEALLGPRFEPLLVKLFTAAAAAPGGHASGLTGPAAAAAAEARAAADAARATADAAFSDGLTQFLTASCLQV